jgi:cytosine/adenosine deaminase-related metal-dependent hydrolase
VPTFAGRLVLQDDVLEGTLEVEGGRVVAWREGELDAKPTAEGWIVASPVNAHTHVADACLRDRPGKPATVAELVGPGGWKESELRRATAEQVVAGVREYVDEMSNVGASAFIDFREGGLAGVELLRGLAPELPVPVRILGRPLANGFEAEEARLLLEAADGIGLSARRDFVRPDDVERWADACHEARKPFALHASETRREDAEAIVALGPAFVVHCTKAAPEDFQVLADADLPVVVCPRSNAYFGMKTPVPAMLQAGLNVAIGTDNGMTNSGDVLAELAQIRSWYPAIGVADLLRMATCNGRRLAGLPTRLPPRAGDAADFIVLPRNAIPAGAGHKPGFLVASGSAA